MSVQQVALARWRLPRGITEQRKMSAVAPLRIVLLGKSMSENSRMGNLILGRSAFDSEAPPDVVERVGGRLKDRYVTLINSPQLLHTNISDDQITQTVRECVSLSAPGPHVVLLLLQHQQCSAEDQERLEKLQDSFSERLLQHTLVLSTQEPTEPNQILQKIIQKCSNRHFSLQGSSSADHLLQAFEDIEQSNEGRHLISAAPSGDSQCSTVEKRDTQPHCERLNVLVCGSGGSLKSSISELILQHTHRRSESVRTDADLHGRLINVLELPDLFNTGLSEEEVMRQTLRCVSLCHPGVHAFLLIIPDAPQTDEDKAEMEEIQRIFSSRINKHIMILIMQNSEHQTAELNEETQAVIQSFGGRHHYFSPKTQVSTLMENIAKMLEENRGGVYSTETFLEAQMNKLMKYEEMKKKMNSLDKEQQVLMDRVRDTEEEVKILEEEKERMRMMIEEERQNHEERKRKEEEPKGEIREEKHQRGEEMKRERETFRHEIEEIRKEKEKIKTEKDKLKAEYETEKERLMNIIENEKQKCIEKEKQYETLKKEKEREMQQIRRETMTFTHETKEMWKKKEQMEREEQNRKLLKEKKEREMRDEMKREREREKLKQEEKKRREEEEQKFYLECLRIVLIGRTGSGKSATGNTILGRKEFLSQLNKDSVMNVCKKGVGEVDGRSVAVVDTPGLFDTTLPNEQVVEEIVKCVSLSVPGPHVFVIVLSLGRFTIEEADTIDLIKTIFGHKAVQFSIVLFTRGDDLRGASIEDYVKRSKSAELQKLIRDCGNRFLAFNNNEKQDKTQVIKLLKMIEEVKTNNQGRYFTNDMFEEAEMSIKKKMEEIMKEKEREMQAQNEALKVKFEIEMKNVMKRLKEEKQRAEEKKMKMENKFREKEENLRKEFEEKEKADQTKQEIQNQKRLEEEKQQRAEYHQRIEEMMREIENQRSQYEQQQKERGDDDGKREEKYRQDQEKMRSEQEFTIAELKKRQEEETKLRDLEKKRRNEEEEEERQRWKIKIKEAENDRKEIQEEIKRQQREWEDEKKSKSREREEEERKREEKHEEQLREKQEELEKMRKKFEREREEERQKMEEERQKQKREREEKEREYEEKRQETKRHYDRLERERKEEWERRKHEEEERREEERKRWKKEIEDLKREQEEEIKKREEEQKERKDREEKEREKLKKASEEEMKEMKKKHEDEARRKAEEFELTEKTLKQILEYEQKLKEQQKKQESLKREHKHLQEEKDDDIKKLKQEVEKLKREKSDCVIL